MYECECGYPLRFWSIKCKACRNIRWRFRHFILYGALLILAFTAILVYLETRPPTIYYSLPDANSKKPISTPPAM
jgi:hypothetical protein